MGFFSPGEMADFETMANTAMDKTAVVYRPDYAGTASPTTIVTTICRITRYPGGGGDALDLSGEATNTFHAPEGTDARPGDEILVNGTRRYLALETNDGRSYPFDLQLAVKRIA